MIYIDGILENITERKLMEQRVLELYSQEKKQRLELQEEAKARGIFIDVLAHELRTPVTPILASIEMLDDLEQESTETVRKRLINNILESSKILVHRLEELLELARFSRGAFKLNLTSIEFGQFIQEVVSCFNPALRQKEQRLAVELPDGLPSVEADSSKLEQVLINLLSNASKFSPDRSLIKLKLSFKGRELQIDVEDQGIGIPLEEQETLFQPYHRVLQDRQQIPGLGLGLAVSRQIIEAHGGKIWLTSQSGRGSIFSFRIPLKENALKSGVKDN